MKQRRLIWVYARPHEEGYEELNFLARTPLEELDQSLLLEMAIESGAVSIGQVDTWMGEEDDWDEVADEHALESGLLLPSPEPELLEGAEEIVTVSLSGKRYDLPTEALREEFLLTARPFLDSRDGGTPPAPDELVRAWRCLAWPTRSGEQIH